MDILQAIILSVVEGVTEFLPVSSTGHMVLVSELLHIPETEFLKSFEVIIQVGAILAVLAVYLKMLVTNRGLWGKLVAAFIPTGVVGLVLYKFIKEFLLGNTEVVLWALLIGGVVLILWERFFGKGIKGTKSTTGTTSELKSIRGERGHIKRIGDLSYKRAVVIGLIQSLSVIPGVSRAAATIIGGMMVGLDRKTAVEFSFLLAVPTLMAATGLDLVKSKFAFSGNEWMLLGIGMIGAFVTAFFTVRYFLRFVVGHTFVGFGVYRIVLAVLFYLLVVR